MWSSESRVQSSSTTSRSRHRCCDAKGKLLPDRTKKHHDQQKLTISIPRWSLGWEMIFLVFFGCGVVFVWSGCRVFWSGEELGALELGALGKSATPVAVCGKFSRAGIPEGIPADSRARPVLCVGNTHGCPTMSGGNFFHSRRNSRDIPPPTSCQFLPG